MTLQLFNWFSKRRLGAVIGLWLFVQGLGLMTKFVLLGQYSYFPSFEEAEDAGQSPSQQNLVYLYYSFLQFSVAGIFILFAGFDWWFFVFHPFQMGIVIDLEEKRQQDKAILRKIELEQDFTNQAMPTISSFR